MDLSFTEEQRILQDSLLAFLAEHYDFERRRSLMSGAPGEESRVWRALAEDLGILGTSFSEAQGGLGGTPVDIMVIMEALGQHLVLEPFLETVVLCGGVLRRSAAPLAAELIGGIIAGELRMALAYAEPQARFCWHDLATSAQKTNAGYTLSGHKSVVVGAPEADWLIVSARTGGARRERHGVALFALERSAAGLERRDYRTIDGRWASEVYLEDVFVPAENLLTSEAEGLPVLEQVLDDGGAAVCAEATGVLRELVSRTVDYTKQRRQFGVPIASFQVLQHRMVDMFILSQKAEAMAYMAALHLGRPAAERAKAISAAKAKAGEACRYVGENAIQLHGGMGITDELPVSHYFKRATLIQSQFGSVDHHLARYERLAFA
ncbi:MAG: acyl-CoA dehydrogenase [Phenylobacterium sp.]|nr:acyl-CoA dehydrogenase [Phenylobacterium sp.]